MDFAISNACSSDTKFDSSSTATKHSFSLLYERIRQKENWSSGKEGYTRVATSLYRMVVPTATSPCIWETSARKAPIISILQNGIVAFLFLYESHYSDSQHCGNDQRKQNEASDLSVGCLLSLWQCVFSLGGYKRVPSSAKEWRGSESGFGMRSWGCTDMNQSFFLRKNAFFKSIWIACKPFAKFSVCRVIKISENKVHELKRRNGRGNGNAAILILPQCQMRLWMFHGNECIAWIKIEP